MSGRSKAGDSALTLADLRHIDELCDRFESAWRAGARPEPEAFLDNGPPKG